MLVLRRCSQCFLVLASTALWKSKTRKALAQALESTENTFEALENIFEALKNTFEALAQEIKRLLSTSTSTGKHQN